MAEALSRGKPYQMLAEEPEHCAGSMLAVLASLWEARSRLKKLEAQSTAPTTPAKTLETDKQNG